MLGTMVTWETALFYQPKVVVTAQKSYLDEQESVCLQN